MKQITYLLKITTKYFTCMREFFFFLIVPLKTDCSCDKKSLFLDCSKSVGQLEEK